MDKCTVQTALNNHIKMICTAPSKSHQLDSNKTDLRCDLKFVEINVQV